MCRRRDGGRAQGQSKGTAPSSFARISLISAMREASLSTANAAATGRNDAAAAVPMAARRPSGRDGVCSAEAPASSVTARVVSINRAGRAGGRREAQGREEVLSLPRSAAAVRGEENGHKPKTDRLPSPHITYNFATSALRGRPTRTARCGSTRRTALASPRSKP